MSAITLVELPRPLRKGIDRRLPYGHQFKNLAGKRFRTRTVIGFAGFRGNFAAWLCKCECGKLVVVESAYLANGSAGCGCTFRVTPEVKKLKQTLNSIKARCYNTSNGWYKAYGARGITVCKRWLRSVDAFAKDMGPRPSPNHVIVRRNKLGHAT